MCHLNWNITWAVALEVTNINFLIAHFATIYENIISARIIINIEQFAKLRCGCQYYKPV